MADETITLIELDTIITRPVHRAPDGTAWVTTWLSVQRRAGGEVTRTTLPVLLRRVPDGTVTLIDLGAAVAFAPLPVMRLPSEVGVDLSRTAPATTRDDALLSAESVRRLCAGERPDLPALCAAITAAAAHFVAFPKVGAATPDDFATFCAAYAISTYLLDAFHAVGYPYFTGLKGSGKSTALQVLARVAFLPLIASESSTLASLRDHADAGGLCVLDNFEAVGGKDESARAMRSFIEQGYQRGGMVTLQVPAGGGRGWETQRCSVYANRAFSAIAEPPDAIESRCIKITMVRTADLTKADHGPWDDDEWPTPPADLQQTGWMVALHCLEDAAQVVRTVTTANTRLTNRDLQKWRPALTVARLVDTENGNTAVWDALLRVAHALLQQGADNGGSREAVVTRLLATQFAGGAREVTATLVLEGAHALAEAEEREIIGLDSVRKVGWLLTRMGIPKARYHDRKVYLLDADLIRTLQAAYLPAPPVIGTDAPDTRAGGA